MPHDQTTNDGTFSTLTVSHMHRETPIQLDEEENGSVEFDSENISSHLYLNRGEERLMGLIGPNGGNWNFQKEGEPFKYDGQLEVSGSCESGLYVTWCVVRSADELFRDREGMHGFKYHHMVTIRKATPEEARSANKEVLSEFDKYLEAARTHANVTPRTRS